MVAFSHFFFGVQLIIKAIDWYEAEKEYMLFPIIDDIDTE